MLQRLGHPPALQCVSTKLAAPLSKTLSPRCPQTPRRHTLRRSAASGVGDAGSEDLAAVADRLNLLLRRPTLTGQDLRDLVFAKWGRTYDVILRKQGSRVYFQVMWRFLEQKSFPLTEAEYMEQLNAVAEYVTEWGAVDLVRRGIQAASQKGPGYTGGGNARCISIPLDVDLGSSRSGEWA